jgi:hypothetical protein
MQPLVSQRPTPSVGRPSKPALLLPAISPLHRPDVVAEGLYLVCVIIDRRQRSIDEASPTLLGAACRQSQSTSRRLGANGKPYARDEGCGVDLEASRKPEASDRLRVASTPAGAPLRSVPGAPSHGQSPTCERMLYANRTPRWRAFLLLRPASASVVMNILLDGTAHAGGEGRFFFPFPPLAFTPRALTAIPRHLARCRVAATVPLRAHCDCISTAVVPVWSYDD